MKKYNKTHQRNNTKGSERQFNKNSKRKWEPKGGTGGRAVRLREGESVDQLIKRFKRVVENSGVLGELKKREYYLSPSQKIREKKKKALKRKRKRLKHMQQYGG